MAMIMKFLMEVRNMTFFTYYGPNGNNFLDFRELYKGKLLFVISTEIKLEKEFYDETIPKWPLKVTVSLGYVGNSSYTIAIKLSLPTSDIPLATQRSCYVMVDKVSRKSSPLPDWFKEKYNGKALFSEPCRVETLNKPCESFRFETMVLWSDTDKNDHANSSAYVHYVTNSLRAALRVQRQQQSSKANDDGRSTQYASNHPVQGLRGINSEIMRSGLKSVRICYVKESEEGDLLHIHLWQEEGDDLGVKAVVERRGEILCHVHLEYFGVTSHL